MEAFTLITPSEGEVLSQHTPLQANFKAMRARLSASQGKVDYLYLKPTELEDDSTPRILTFAWENAREDFCPQCVEVAENPIFTGHVMHFAVLPGRQETRGHSLKTNTKYYWRVAGIDETDSPVYQEMIASVEQYGGFYIGRYEASQGQNNFPASKRVSDSEPAFTVKSCAKM